MASIFRQRYTVKDKAGKTIRKQSKYCYIDYKTSDGTRKRLKGFKDKSATTQFAAELERKAELARAGIVDRYAKYRKTPLKEHLDDYRHNMVDRETVPNMLRRLTIGPRRSLKNVDLPLSVMSRHLLSRTIWQREDAEDWV